MSSDYSISTPLELGGVITVPSGSVKNTYSLKLVGRGAPGYGIAFAENTVFTLNHRASEVGGRPPNPLIGQIWYNHTSKQLMHYVGVANNVIGADSAGWATVTSTTSGNGFATTSVQASIAANSTNQASATVLTASICEVTSASAGQDSVKLPDAIPGRKIIVINASPVAVQVFPVSGSQIETAPMNSSYVLGSSARMQFVAISNNKWYSLSSVYE